MAISRLSRGPGRTALRSLRARMPIVPMPLSNSASAELSSTLSQFNANFEQFFAHKEHSGSSETDLDPKSALNRLIAAMESRDAALEIDRANMQVGDRASMAELQHLFESLYTRVLGTTTIDSISVSEGKFNTAMATFQVIYAKSHAATAILLDCSRYLAGAHPVYISEPLFEAVGVEVLMAWATLMQHRCNLRMGVILEALNSHAVWFDVQEGIKSVLHEEDLDGDFARSHWATHLKRSQTLTKQLGIKPKESRGGQAPFQRGPHNQSQGGGGGFGGWNNSGNSNSGNSNNSGHSNTSNNRSRGGFSSRGKK